MDDKSLLNKLKSMNKDNINESFKQIYNKYYKLLYFIILSIVKTKEDVNDLIQDTFFNLILNKNKVNNLKYYLVTIAKNKAIDFIRKRKKIVLNDFEYFDSFEIEENDELFDLLNNIKLYIYLSDFDILVNHLIYDISLKEIAKKIGCNYDTVKSKYNRALKKLRKEFKYER